MNFPTPEEIAERFILAAWRARRPNVICENCDYIFDGRQHSKCPNCGRDIIPPELEEAQKAMEQSYAEKGLAGSLETIRPLMAAVVETVSTLAPMFPKSQLQAAMNETAVFTLLVELERRGFRVVPVPVEL